MAHVTTFPAGKYYVGDPCYVVASDDWDDYCTKYFATEEENSGKGGPFEIGGHQVWMASTAYGDGGYRGSDGFEYSVDSGTIGVIPFDLVDQTKLRDGKIWGGNIIEFDKPFDVYLEGGTFFIGHISIPTEWEDSAYWEEEDVDYSDRDEEDD